LISSGCWAVLKVAVVAGMGVVASFSVRPPSC
jgi:hypothetical protein